MAKMSKGTSSGQDLSYEPIPRSLRPSVTKKQPGKESMTDGRTDGRTDGQPESIGPQPLGLGPNKHFDILFTTHLSPPFHVILPGPRIIST